MARRQRDLTQSEWFHVVNRGADRQDIFATDHDRFLYESLLEESFARYGVELHAYAWMTNHVHHLVHIPDGGLSEAMQRLGSRYASAFNQSTGREGPLFTSRFYSGAITSDAQLVQTARYIHRNPLAFVPTSAISAYRWSSLGVLCGRRPAPSWLSTGIIDTGNSERALLDHVLTPQPADRMAFGGLRPSTATTCDQIDEAVARVSSLPIEALCSPGTGPNELRMLAITLAVELRADDSAALAVRYGLSDRRSVRRAARRGRVRYQQSPQFARLRQRVLADLDAAA